MPLTRYDPTRDELGAVLGGDVPRYRLDQVWSGLYDQLAPLEAISTLPRAQRAELAAALPEALTPVLERVGDGGATLKAVFQIAGGALVEIVLMLYPERATVCVSSQAGCAMGCGFCATGQAGFERHLTTGEIVEQVVWAARRARASGRRLSNVVFMGMGEPLANYEAVWRAVRRLHGSLGLSARHLTLSTVGLAPGIRRLAGEALPVNLAVSLHAADDATRDELVPINRRYPLDQLMDACAGYLAARGRRLSFEWALIDGANDRAGDARALAARCARLPLAPHVNLIALNPTPGWPSRGTPPDKVAWFRDQLVARGVNATVRRNRGTEIEAACGQLAGATRRAGERIPVAAR